MQGQHVLTREDYLTVMFNAITREVTRVKLSLMDHISDYPLCMHTSISPFMMVTAVEPVNLGELKFRSTASSNRVLLRNLFSKIESYVETMENDVPDNLEWIIEVALKR
jgi:hypothetical protein